MQRADGPALILEVGGVEYEARDYAYASNVLQLADTWSATLPAPEGKIRATTGEMVAAHEALTLGARVRLYTRDPDVRGGHRQLALTGRLVTIDDTDGPQGYSLRLSGFDLGWHLATGNVAVWQNVKGVELKTFIGRNLGVTIGDDGATVAGTDSFGWGFAGVRFDNLTNKRARLNRAELVYAKSPPPPGKKVLFQTEVGQSLGPILVDFARREKRLVNVSSDGWLQFFRPASPNTADPVLYSFAHRSRLDSLGVTFNNVETAALRRSAEDLFTRVECWTSRLIPAPTDPAAKTDNPNEGRYRGTFANIGTFPFARRCTFSDPEQVSREAADNRARWKWARGQFDSWEYTITVTGHSQQGTPYMPDTLCDVVDEMRGIHGTYYISAVTCKRSLARVGRDPAAGSRSILTIRPAGFLGG